MKRMLLNLAIDTTIAAIIGALFYFAVVGQVHGQSVAPTSAPAPGDPSGFTELLNQQRAQRGLQPVTYNISYVSVAQTNNYYQSSHGLGHHFLGGLAQCAGVGVNDARSILSLWLGSPGHAAILLDPALSVVGYHQQGTCHTVSCSSGSVLPPQVGHRPVPTQPGLTVIPLQVQSIYNCYPARRGLFGRCRCR